MLFHRSVCFPRLQIRTKIKFFAKQKTKDFRKTVNENEACLRLANSLLSKIFIAFKTKSYV